MKSCSTCFVEFNSFIHSCIFILVHDCFISNFLGDLLLYLRHVDAFRLYIAVRSCFSTMLSIFHHACVFVHGDCISNLSSSSRTYRGRALTLWRLLVIQKPKLFVPQRGPLLDVERSERCALS